MAHTDFDHPQPRHEESDVNIGAIFGFGAGLAAVMALVCVGVWLMFGFMDRRAIPQAARRSPLADGQERRLPPEPRLQVTPRQDLNDFRAREDEVLNGYRWVDKTAGVVRIPIGEAMKLTVQRGLPARAAPEERSK